MYSNGIYLFSRVDPDFEIYHISYLWYTLVGALVTIIVAVITSFISGPNKPSQMNPMLLAPFVRKLIWGKDFNSCSEGTSKSNAISKSDCQKKESLEEPNCLELS